MLKYVLVNVSCANTARWGSGRTAGRARGGRGLTGVQLEHELDRVVVEVAAVLDDLDQGRQAALA